MPDQTDRKPPSIEESTSPAGVQDPDRQVPDLGTTPVTGSVIIDNDRIIPAREARPGREAYSFEAAVKTTAADLVTVLLRQDQRHLLPKVMGRVGSLVALAGSVDVNRAPVKLPANHTEVQAAGQELVTVAATDPDADFMEVDTQAAQPVLDRAAFLHELYTQVAWLPTAIHNNWTHEINGASTVIESAYEDKKVNRVLSNVRLAGKLPLSLDLVTGRGKKAAETMKQNQRVAQEAVAKDRAKHGSPPAAAPAAPPSDPNKKP